jgi:hypothetical protein
MAEFMTAVLNDVGWPLAVAVGVVTVGAVAVVAIIATAVIYLTRRGYRELGWGRRKVWFKGRSPSRGDSDSCDAPRQAPGA